MYSRHYVVHTCCTKPTDTVGAHSDSMALHSPSQPTVQELFDHSQTPGKPQCSVNLAV